jgi:hypothetical protein
MRKRPYPRPLIENRDDASHIFNEGSDARKQGLPASANPYENAGGTSSMWYQWRSGWIDRHLNWGRDVRGRWRTVPDPPVENADILSM